MSATPNFANPKQVSRAADGLFLSSCPKNWARRSQQDSEDYGIDYEIEVITPQDSATGIIFKAQIKGESKPYYLASGILSYSDLRTDKLEYYLHHVKIPVFIIVVDVSREIVYWNPVHANVRLEEALKEAKSFGRKTVSIHFDPEHVLPNTADELLLAVEQAQGWIALHIVANLNVASLLNCLNTILPDERLAAKLQNNLAATKLLDVDRMIFSGDFNKAAELANGIAGSKAEPFDYRLLAFLRIEKIEILRNPTSDTVREVGQEMSFSLCHVVRSEKRELIYRTFSVLLLRIAKFAVAVDQFHGVQIALQVERPADELFNSKEFLASASLGMLTTALSQLEKIQWGVHRLFKAPRYTLWAVVLERLMSAMVDLLAILRATAQGLLSTNLTAWVVKIAELLFAYYVQAGDDDQAANICILMPSLWLGASDEEYQHSIDNSRNMLNGLLAKDAISRGHKALDALVQIYAEAKSKMTTHIDDAFYYDFARRLGVPIEDPNDQTAQIIRIGIRDRNPERILKHCVHLLVTLVSSGLPAEMMGLPTAGLKRLTCVKHGYSVAALSLDGIYQRFAANYCEACSDCIPHALDWTWNTEYQLEREEQHRKRPV